MAVGSDDLLRRRVVVQLLPAGQRRAGELPDLARVVQLVDVAAIGHDADGRGVVVDHLPAGQRRAGVAPDQARVVALVEVSAGCSDLHRRGIVVELLPASERRAGELPDLARVMQLVELAAVGRERDRGRVVVEQLPVREHVARDGRRLPQPGLLGHGQHRAHVDDADRVPCEQRVPGPVSVDARGHRYAELARQPRQRAVAAQRDAVILVAVRMPTRAEPAGLAAGRIPGGVDLVRRHADLDRAGADRALQDRRVGPIDRQMRTIVVDDVVTAEPVALHPGHHLLDVGTFEHAVASRPGNAVGLGDKDFGVVARLGERLFRRDAVAVVQVAPHRELRRLDEEIGGQCGAGGHDVWRGGGKCAAGRGNRTALRGLNWHLSLLD